MNAYLGGFLIAKSQNVAGLETLGKFTRLELLWRIGSMRAASRLAILSEGR
jgi:hypothetical protein